MDPEIYEVHDTEGTVYALQSRNGLCRIFGWRRVYNVILPKMKRTKQWSDKFRTVREQHNGC